MRRVAIVIAFGAGGAAALAQAPPTPPDRVVIAQSGITPPPVSLLGAGHCPPDPLTTGTTSPRATAEPADAVYPITLTAALKLAGSRPLDIAIADQQVALAARQLDRAKLAWVPNVVVGLDYFRHEGVQQNFAGELVRSSRGNYMVGAGPNAVVSVTDAVFGPLAAKQDLRARSAFRRAVENDTTLAVVEAYFAAQQARGELAGAALAAAKAKEVTDKTVKLAEGLVPPLEASRAKVELARREQAVATARERWRTASAELVRLLRLQPGVLLEPLEEPYLPVTIIDPNATADVLLPVALTTRPELAGQQAVAQASAERLRQERVRPLLPSVGVRSVSTNPSGSLAWGGFGGGPNDTRQAFASRFDLSAQLLWEFQAFGLTNRVRVGERRSEQQIAVLELARTQDRIAAEVATVYAQAKAAGERLAKAEPALREAVELVEASLAGMGQTKRVGETNVQLVRPQEVVAAVQLLAQANADFYASVADYNRGQFRLYRALGHPADVLCQAVGAKAAVPLTQPPEPMPPPLPAVGSTLPNEGAVHAEARVVVPPPPLQRQTGWKDLAIGREVVYRRTSAAVVASTELPPEPATPPAPVVTVSTEPDWRSAQQPASPPAVQAVPTPVPTPTPAPTSPPPAPKPVPAEEPLNWNKAK
jgi:outer membrane protein TolC